MSTPTITLVETCFVRRNTIYIFVFEAKSIEEFKYKLESFGSVEINLAWWSPRPSHFL